MNNAYTAAVPSAVTVFSDSLSFEVLDDTTVPSQSTLVASPLNGEVTSISSNKYTYSSRNAVGTP